MCGITGIFTFNQDVVSSEILKSMTDVLAHRGPDGEGIFVDKNIGFGHRRLAIIDLSDAGKGQEIQRISRDRPPLKVIQCSSDELVEHQKTLDMLEKSSGACLWNQ